MLAQKELCSGLTIRTCRLTGYGSSWEATLDDSHRPVESAHNVHHMFYGDAMDADSLAALYERGVEDLEFWCLNPKCKHRGRVDLTFIRLRYGGYTRMAEVARNGVCRECRRKGGHVQPVEPDMNRLV